jgi:hypothetical protein
MTPEAALTAPKSPARSLFRRSPRWEAVLLGILWVAVAAVLGFQFGVNTRPQVVYRAPAEDELVVCNGCVVSACQYLACVRAKHMLQKDFWSRVMLVRYKGTTAGHAYCVWETDGQLFGYDRNNGGWPIPSKEREPEAIAQALAGELGKVLGKPMDVERAEFIEPSDARLYAF